LEDFFEGPGETLLGKGEILTEIVMDKPSEGSGAGYVKLGIRESLEISLVNAAAFISVDSRDGSIKTARIALGSVAPTPIRAVSAEQRLLGQKPNEALFAGAGEAAAEDSSPIDDFRASAEYKRAMVQVLTQRALSMAYDEAGR
jgi:carbon-monoxide dehydrogenase medium subunit